ncbi:F510_1955 family glycosylhydrolase [Bacillus sp. KH172YL63]|uniref:F510_1955 family glycosylhydrolase n=1 Tax=Bacillus sp. KH172YL63 TaxID=2709784 RepID=UPI0013E436C6|nr:sialidase [Bacillus sp. KH172YL63]BCB05589.1 hypothetical protein KH172YL63_37220 [Bacillus sp. KH172YL63]
MKKISALFLITSLSLAGCSSSKEEYSFIKTDNTTIDHIHGIGYPDHKGELVIATHDGLMKYKDAVWYETTGEKHDYMGFQASEDGFYSSGHPEKGSDLKNPLGVVKSTDEGETLEKLAFYGELDFHYLGAGYSSRVLYALNEEPHPELEAGLHRTMDEGENWEQLEMKGFDSTSIGNIAIHPTNQDVLAISSKDGLFISRDGGDSFQNAGDAKVTTSVYLTEESGLLARIEEGSIQLYELDQDSLDISPFPTPELSQDNPIMYISGSPVSSEEWSIVTYENDIFTTTDNGRNWERLADKGKLPQSN